MRSMRPIRLVMASLAALTAVAIASPNKVGRLAVSISRRIHAHSVEDRLRTYEGAVRARLASDLARERLGWPLRHVWLVAYKSEKRLDVFGADANDRPRFIRSYAIAGASGALGPKLRQGDRQVPEGMYRVESLNPDSLYHLALRVDYPNADDRAMAARDGRAALGGDIMIHGGSGSIGCLAMGDEAAEDLFVLAARAGAPHVEVWIAPIDFRAHPEWTAPASLPVWVDGRYQALRAALASLPPRR